MKVIPIPLLSDNYGYLLVDEKTNEAAVVDPVEPAKVAPVVRRSGGKLRAILTTHHHADHAAGNPGMLKEFPGLKVYGGDDRVDALDNKVGDGEKFHIGSLEVTALHTPCHTRGHTCYYVVDPATSQKCVFTGDTLFIGGCGRFFEGTPDQMYTALIKILGSLPHETECWVGHEYTKSNLRFAASVEPTNPHIKSKLEWCDTVPQTIPSTIGEEFKINPFMRVEDPEVKKSLGLDDPIAVMGKLREMKNRFR
ncbi:hypothetical protein HK102_012361 [Quaeritorhiza haematococci]|nr:hypothetical protein HK102_012361 [Quaeritorhiza haematococci]